MKMVVKVIPHVQKVYIKVATNAYIKSVLEIIENQLLVTSRFLDKYCNILF